LDREREKRGTAAAHSASDSRSRAGFFGFGACGLSLFSGDHRWRAFYARTARYRVILASVDGPGAKFLRAWKWVEAKQQRTHDPP